MNTLRDYVEWKLTHSDKVAEAGGYPLILEKCKKNKKMKDLKVYGNSVHDGTPTPENPVEVQSIGEKTENLYNHATATVFMAWRISTVNAVCDKGKIESVINESGTGGFLNVKIDNASNYRGKSLVCTWKAITANNINLSYTGLCIYDADNKNILESSSKKFGDDGYNCNVLVIPDTIADTDKLTFRLYLGKGQKGDIIGIHDLMIFEGTKPRIYEPYGYKIPIIQSSENTEPIIHSIYLDEPLRKIGDYTDYIDFANKKVVRTIAQMILNGSENIQTFAGEGVASYPYTYLNLGSYGMVINDICLCNQLTLQNNFSYSREGVNVFRIFNSSNGDSRFAFRLYQNGNPVVETNEIKNALSQKYGQGQPLKIYYALATTKTEDIECQLPKITEKTTVFTVDSTIEPSNMYGKYIK